MNDIEAKRLDAILRILYRGNQPKVWRSLYKEAGIEKLEADSAFRIMKADGYVKTFAKGDGTEDSYYVTITDTGISFFSRSSYEEELNKKNPANHAGITIHGSTVRDINVNSSKEVVKERKPKSLFREYLKEILVVLGLLITLITTCYTQKNNTESNLNTELNKANIQETTRVNTMKPVVESQNKAIPPQIKNHIVEPINKPKYDLSHATLNQSAVGDNAKVENFNGIKPRQLDNAMFMNLMQRVQKFWDEHSKADRTTIEVAPSPDKDSRQLAAQLEAQLKFNNIKVTHSGSMVSQIQSNDKENFSVIIDTDNKNAMIIVLEQPNVQ